MLSHEFSSYFFIKSLTLVLRVITGFGSTTDVVLSFGSFGATSTLVSACAFEGRIEAGVEVGGIASISSADDRFVNCHVVADIYGKGTIGGIIGSSDRSKVENCYIEGNIELVEAAKGGKVGGVIGAMGSTLSDSVYALVANNIVALEEIKLPTDTMELYAHRIVGYSNGDSFEYDWDKLNPSKPKEEWPKIYNEAEKCLKSRLR